MLYDDAMEPFRIMDKTTTADGYGGVVTTWVDGAEIQAAIETAGGTERLTAMQLGWNGLYTVVTRRSVVLMDGDVIKRVSDGMTLRIKSNGTDSKTPPSAGLDMRVVDAEGYTL